MTTYREGQGYRIRSVTSDPDNAKVGQVWYNSTELKLKGKLSVPASWASGGNLNTNKTGTAGAGTQTAGLAFGGSVPPTTTATKNYDGTTWTASPASLGTAAKRHGGTPSGTDAAAVAFGGDGPGSNTNISQEYNKSANVITAAAWASAPAISTGRYLLVGAGSTYNATVVFGGVTNPGSTYRAQTEEYDGTSWSEDGDMSTARFLPAKDCQRQGQ